MSEKSREDTTAEDEAVSFNTRLPRELIKHMKLYCVDGDMKISQFVRDAITEKLRRDRRLLEKLTRIHEQYGIDGDALLDIIEKTGGRLTDEHWQQIREALEQHVPLKIRKRGGIGEGLKFRAVSRKSLKKKATVRKAG